MGHSLTKPTINTIGNISSSKQQYSSNNNMNAIMGTSGTNIMQMPGSSHGGAGSSYPENNQNIANQKSLNSDNMISGPLPKPNVKIVDL